MAKDAVDSRGLARMGSAEKAYEEITFASDRTVCADLAIRGLPLQDQRKLSEFQDVSIETWRFERISKSHRIHIPRY